MLGVWIGFEQWVSGTWKCYKSYIYDNLTPGKLGNASNPRSGSYNLGG